jgi:hypothetical protein
MSMRGGPGKPGPPRTLPGQGPHKRRTAQRPRVRALHAAIPARSPLIPNIPGRYGAALPRSFTLSVHVPRILRELG